MERHPAHERLAGGGTQPASAKGLYSGQVLASGLGALANAPPRVERPDGYFAEVSRARNGALTRCGYSFGVPRSECERGVRNREMREHLFGDAPIRFTPSDRSMVFLRFETHYFVKTKPNRHN